MIGLVLVVDGFGFHIPKGYVYAAIGFSVLIEILNQLAARGRRTAAASGMTSRQQVADAVLGFWAACRCLPMRSRQERCSARTSGRWWAECSPSASARWTRS